MTAINRMTATLAMVLTALLLLSACGTKVVRGAAPIVRMNELSHADNTITLQISMRNLNGAELEVHSIDFSLSVNDEELFVYKGPAETIITANGIETWTVEVEESEASKYKLEQLEAGEIKSLPYSLQGSITALDEDLLHFSHEGHLYPVPGRPGHFR